MPAVNTSGSNTIKDPSQVRPRNAASNQGLRQALANINPSRSNAELPISLTPNQAAAATSVASAALNHRPA